MGLILGLTSAVIILVIVILLVVLFRTGFLAKRFGKSSDMNFVKFSSNYNSSLDGPANHGNAPSSDDAPPSITLSGNDFSASII